MVRSALCVRSSVRCPVLPSARRTIRVHVASDSRHARGRADPLLRRLGAHAKTGLFELTSARCWLSARLCQREFANVPGQRADGPRSTSRQVDRHISIHTHIHIRGYITNGSPVRRCGDIERCDMPRATRSRIPRAYFETAARPDPAALGRRQGTSQACRSKLATVRWAHPAKHITDRRGGRAALQGNRCCRRSTSTSQAQRRSGCSRRA